MIADLKNYQPSNPEYVLDESALESLPLELDFSTVEGFSGKSVSDVLKFVGKTFAASFPDNETAVRKLDEFEKRNIREEYCEKQENDLPKKLEHLNETLEKIKVMKKEAEEQYSACLSEIAQYAAAVKNGKKEVLLKANETFCIALNGKYAYYKGEKGSTKVVLVKAFDVLDPTDLWSSEEQNRQSMYEFFGIEFPSIEAPNDDVDDDDLPM